MKKLIILVLFYLSFVTTWAEPESFEGFLKYQVNMVDDISKKPINLEMDFYIKKNVIRIEFEAPNGKLIFLFENENAFMLIPSNKIYTKLPLDYDSTKIQEQFQTILDSKTKQTKKIFGYDCNLYIYSNQNDVFELWCSSFGKTKFLIPLLSEQKIDKIQFPEGVVPLEVRLSDKNNIEKGSFVLKNIEKRKLEDSLFLLPADYTKMGE